MTPVTHASGTENLNVFKSWIWLVSGSDRTKVLHPRCRQNLYKCHYITGIPDICGLLIILWLQKRHFWRTKSGKIHGFSSIFRELFFIRTLFFNNNRVLKVNLGSKRSSSTAKVHGFRTLRVHNPPGSHSACIAYSGMFQNQAIWLAVKFMT